MPCQRSQACASALRVPSDSTVDLSRPGRSAARSSARRALAARPLGAVRTPTTRRSSVKSAAAGKPVNRLTPAASAFSPSQRTISQIEAT